MKKEIKKVSVETDLGWSTHIPVLLKLLRITDGPIMEIGSGLYSTPILHWWCSENNRELVTYEDNMEFIDYAVQFRSDFHKIKYIDDFRNIPKDKHYSIIFIDHNGHLRGWTAKHLKDTADYIVIHDSNVVERNAYDKAFPHFKHKKDFTSQKPWTTVLSNLKELEDLW